MLQSAQLIRRKKGFTLIELLVVISIMAILAVIGMTAYSGAQKSARLAKRVEDLGAIKTALELYYSKNGSYPNTGETAIGCINTSTIWKSECKGSIPSDQVIPGLVPGYLVVFPQDPQMNKETGTSCYKYTSNSTDYKLWDDDISEFTPEDYQSQINLIDPARDGGGDLSIVDGTTPTAWAAYTDGARCW